MDVYEIKPLEWKEFLDGWFYVAKTPFGNLYVELQPSGKWRVTSRATSPKLKPSLCESKASGKAKAEAFYRERILQALVPVKEEA